MQVAELAGIMGAKHTCFLIPLCHNISLKCVLPHVCPASAAVYFALPLSHI